MDSRASWLVGVLLCAAAGWWLVQSQSVEASDVQRSLADSRLDQLPWGLPALPAAWQDELDQAVARAPRVSLLDATAPALAAEVLRGVHWVDPLSVHASLVMPDGIRVEFEPRKARFLLVQGNRPVGVLAHDGTRLPPGLPVETRKQLLQVELGLADQIPAAGRRVASPIAQEALRAWDEILKFEEASGLRVRRVKARSAYRGAVSSVTPPLTFELADGREIEWGRSQASRDPHTPSVTEKMAWLGAAVRQYPGLERVQVIALDHPDGPLLLNQEYRELPFDSKVVLPR